MNIGETIKNRRQKRNFTQAELADMLNVTPQAVSRWEMGTHSVQRHHKRLQAGAVLDRAIDPFREAAVTAPPMQRAVRDPVPVILYDFGGDYGIDDLPALGDLGFCHALVSAWAFGAL